MLSVLPQPVCVSLFRPLFSHLLSLFPWKLPPPVTLDPCFTVRFFFPPQAIAISHYSASVFGIPLPFFLNLVRWLEPVLGVILSSGFSHFAVWTGFFWDSFLGCPGLKNCHANHPLHPFPCALSPPPPPKEGLPLLRFYRADFFRGLSPPPRFFHRLLTPPPLFF